MLAASRPGAPDPSAGLRPFAAGGRGSVAGGHGATRRALMSKRELGPGDLFLHYKIARVIGQGGMGRVYEAEHQFLRRRTALKVMLSERVGAEMRERMIQEARSLAELKHPNIVLVYDAGIADDDVWIAMEYLEGRT